MPSRNGRQVGDRQSPGGLAPVLGMNGANSCTESKSHGGRTLQPPCEQRRVEELCAGFRGLLSAWPPTRRAQRSGTGGCRRAGMATSCRCRCHGGRTWPDPRHQRKAGLDANDGHDFVVGHARFEAGRIGRVHRTAGIRNRRDQKQPDRQGAQYGRNGQQEPGALSKDVDAVAQLDRRIALLDGVDQCGVHRDERQSDHH